MLCFYDPQYRKVIVVNSCKGCPERVGNICKFDKKGLQFRIFFLISSNTLYKRLV